MRRAAGEGGGERVVEPASRSSNDLGGALERRCEDRGAILDVIYLYGPRPEGKYTYSRAKGVPRTSRTRGLRGAGEIKPSRMW